MRQCQYIKTFINLNVYLFLLSCFASNYGFSQTVVWSEGFEGLTTSCGSSAGSTLVTTSCTPANWLTSKNYPWIASSTAFRTGSRCIRMTNNWTGWLITAGANLDANITYNLTFYYKGICSSSCTAGMTVKVGVTNTQNLAPTNTTTVVSNGTQSNYTQFIYSYTPTVSGTYYFGLQMSSTIAGFDNGYIDDMQLSYNCSAPTTPLFTSGATNICTGGTSTYVATSIGTISYSVLSGGASVNSTTGVVSNVESDFVIRATANTGCGTATADQLVIVHANPTAPIVSNNGNLTFCEGQNVQLYSNLAFGNLWSTNEITQSILVTSSGNYSLVYTDANGCSASSNSITVQVNPLPVAQIIPQGLISFCAGGSVVLNSSSSTGNLWSNSNQSQYINVSNSGDYFVTVTNNNGCTGTSNTISVIINPLPAVPTISANGPITFCQGNTVVLTASSNGGNSWSNQASTNNITVNTAGAYTVTNTNSDGCSTTSLPIVVNVDSNPIAIASLISENVIEASPIGLNYQWISCSSNAQIVGANSVSYTATTNGSYSVIVTNNSGCKDTSDCVTVSKVGIDDMSYLSNVQLFPNPAGNEVNVQFKSSIPISQYDFKLYDTQGKLVKSERMMNSDSIDIAEFNPGMYILEVQTEVGNSIHRLIKE